MKNIGQPNRPSVLKIKRPDLMRICRIVELADLVNEGEMSGKSESSSEGLPFSSKFVDTLE